MRKSKDPVLDSVLDFCLGWELVVVESRGGADVESRRAISRDPLDRGFVLPWSRKVPCL